MYEALINSLRICSNDDSDCLGCVYSKTYPNEPMFITECGILDEAADALEDLSKKNESMEQVVHCWQCMFWNERNGKCGVTLDIIDDPDFFCAHGDRDLSKDYVDKETVIRAVIDLMPSGADLTEILDCIGGLEPADVRPVLNGMWLAVDDKDDAFDCSRCGAMVQKRVNYCPRCGASMRKSNRLK